MKRLFGMDDDKLHYTYGRARNVPFLRGSGLNRVCHVRDNKTGFVNHVVCYAASDLPLVSKFEHEDHANIHECFEDIMRELFHLNGRAKPNLSGHATFAVDRGYLRRLLFKW